MFNPHTKFEMSMITCNEEIKGNAKCKNSRFEPPFKGDLGVTYRVHLCRFPISDNKIFQASSHGCCTIKRNLSKSAFPGGVGHFERTF